MPQANDIPIHADHDQDETPIQRLESAFGQAESGVKNDVSDKTPRTRGLWIFDNVLFNLTNLSVFALSVYATYKTNFSQSPSTPKAQQNWWMRRGTEFTNLFCKAGMNEEMARNGNMVLWSFVDGTVAAPFVALLKRKRTEIGRWIDDKLGTTPEDKTVYDRQPKEGWKSVLTGRLAAFSIVMPTYFLLSMKNKKNPESLSLNNILFDKTADAIVRHDVAGIPSALRKRYPKLDVEGLTKTSVFEVFYTTVCTSILFLVSFVTGRKDQRKAQGHAPEPAAPPAGAVESPQEATLWRDKALRAPASGMAPTL